MVSLDVIVIFMRAGRIFISKGHLTVLYLVTWPHAPPLKGHVSKQTAVKWYVEKLNIRLNRKLFADIYPNFRS